MLAILTACYERSGRIDAILPRRSDTRPFGLQIRRLQEGDDIGVKLRVAVEDDVTIWTSFGKGLPQLLDNSLGSRMASHVEMQDLPSPMLDHEEAVQQFEWRHRHCEEVEGHDHLAMVLEKRQPPFTRVATAADTPKIPGQTPFGDDEAELLKFSVDFGGSPIRVLLRQALDQNTNLIGDLRSAAARPGSPTPVETETGAVPADDGLTFHDDEDLGPPGPHVMQGRSEESIKRVHYWPRPFAFEHGDLLSEGEDLEGGIVSTAEEDAESGQD